jgi:hypothetical protein
MKLPTVELGLRRPLGIEQTVFNQPFWQGLSNGQFLLASCKNCSRRSFPPKAVCPGCHGEDFDWVPATGKGVIYSYTRIQTSGATIHPNKCLDSQAYTVYCLYCIQSLLGALRIRRR